MSVPAHSTVASLCPNPSNFSTFGLVHLSWFFDCFSSWAYSLLPLRWLVGCSSWVLFVELLGVWDHTYILCCSVGTSLDRCLPPEQLLLFEMTGACTWLLFPACWPAFGSAHTISSFVTSRVLLYIVSPPIEPWHETSECGRELAHSWIQGCMLYPQPSAYFLAREFCLPSTGAVFQVILLATIFLWYWIWVCSLWPWSW